eukprot:7460816-Pyramimonas_sp.AAC.1
MAALIPAAIPCPGSIGSDTTPPMQRILLHPYVCSANPKECRRNFHSITVRASCGCCTGP